MKQNLLSAALLSMAMAVTMSSCSDDDAAVILPVDTSNALMTSSITSFVDDVVISTYSNLADKAIALNDACVKLSGDLSDDNIKAAADAWVAARKYWENSEAFLFGPAGDYAIDPHIDSWPLDQTALDNLLSNTSLMSGFYDDDNNIGGDDAITYAGETLGSTLIGVH